MVRAERDRACRAGRRVVRGGVEVGGGVQALPGLPRGGHAMTRDRKVDVGEDLFKPGSLHIVRTGMRPRFLSQ